MYPPAFLFFFFFHDTATTEIYTLSLHDALPIFAPALSAWASASAGRPPPASDGMASAATMRLTSGRTTMNSTTRDRKSTRLNSSHSSISYAVFCLKKKKKKKNTNKKNKSQLTN